MQREWEMTPIFGLDSRNLPGTDSESPHMLARFCDVKVSCHTNQDHVIFPAENETDDNEN
jgi:hypothetical protein